jgi:hypothetical protein
MILDWYSVSAEWKCWSVQQRMTTISKRSSAAFSLCPGSYLPVEMTVLVDSSDAPVHMLVQAARTSQVGVLEVLPWSLQVAVWPPVQKEQQEESRWPALSQEAEVLSVVRAVKPNNKWETLMMIAIFHRWTSYLVYLVCYHSNVTCLGW